MKSPAGRSEAESNQLGGPRAQRPRSAGFRSIALLTAAASAFASGCGPIPESQQPGAPSAPTPACKDAPAPKLEYVRAGNGDPIFDYRNPYLGINVRVPDQDPNCQLPVQVILAVRRELLKDGHAFIEPSLIEIGSKTLRKPGEDWVSGRAEGALRVVDFQVTGTSTKSGKSTPLGVEDLPY